MRVAFLTTSFPRYPGDYAGVFVYDLAKELVRLGIAVHVLAPRGDSLHKQEITDGIKVTRFNYFYPKSFEKLAYGAGIPTNLRSSRIASLQVLPFALAFMSSFCRLVPTNDIVHAHWIETGMLGLVGARIHKRPLVVSVHRFNPQGIFGKSIYRLVLRKADNVLFNSTYTRRRSIHALGQVVGTVIPPGVDTTKFHSKWGRSFTKRPISKQMKPVVLSVGSLVPVKGFLYLVEAMPLVLAKVDCRFVIVGGGPERARIKNLAIALGVNQSLSMLGIVATEEIPGLMRQADVFVLPSAPHESGDDESLGMVLAEASASGTPCVATNTGGISDIVVDGVNGILVRPGSSLELAQAILELISDADRREEMGRSGRGLVEARFSVSTVALKTKAVYESLVAE